MNLDEAQQQKVISWIEQGLQPADIQKRLADELGVRMTYMEVRFLLADLNLKPKDKEVAPTPPPASVPPAGPGARQQTPGMPLEDGLVPNDAAGSGAGGAVSVSVDQLTRAGAMVSGKVTFSDGKQADWYLDQMGRLGLAPKEKGYRPPQSDLMEFQAALQDQLAKLGF
jgi:hypothetical protein